MKSKTKIKLDLLPAEKHKFRANNIKLSDITIHSPDELSIMLNVSIIRAMEIFALVEFQSIPSLGIKFARDLISMGYYSLDELKDKDGAKLIDDLELLTGHLDRPMC